jgi:hypothetical protein
MFQNKINNDLLVKNLVFRCHNNQNLHGKARFLHEQNIKDKYKYINILHCDEFILDKQRNELVEIDNELHIWTFKTPTWAN